MKTRRRAAIVWAVIQPLPEVRAPLATTSVRFCSHCAAREEDPDSVEALIRRVCPECGLGVLLRAAPDLVLGSTVLVVVTPDLRISAATVDVEALLGYPELLFGRSLLEIGEIEGLAHPVAAAALGAKGITQHTLEVGGRSLKARVGSCGDPLAALVVLDS